MSRQIIDVGATLNDGSGESLRDAFIKVNNNFFELFTGGIAGTNIVILNNSISSIQGNIELSPVGNNPVKIANSNPLILSNAAVSTSITTGALQIAGGAGIVGNLNIGASLNVTGATSVGNLTANNVFGTYYYANGQALTATLYTNSNVTSYLPTHSGNLAANYVFANFFRYANGDAFANYTNSNVAAYLPVYAGLLGGTLTTAAQPNITSLGALSSLTAGTITAATLNANQIGNAGTILTGVLNTAAQTIITSLGTLTGLTVSGTANITNARGNFGGPFNGAIGATTPNTAAFSNIALNIADANILRASIVGNTGTSIVGTLATSNQNNITNLGTLTSLTSSGVVNINNTDNATGDTTGALRIAGGASISKDLWVIGNIYTANIVAVGTSTLTVATPLLYLNSSNTFPYNYDIGFYSNAVSGAANLDTFTGIVRSYTDNTWYFFSNADTPITTVDFANSSLILDTIKIGGANVQGTLEVTDTSSLNDVDATSVYALFIGNSGTELTGTVITNAQPYITSVGVLASLEIGGTLTANTVTADGIQAANIGNSGTELTGTITTNAQPYIESVGNLLSLSVVGAISGSDLVLTGNIDANNFVAVEGVYSPNYYYGNGLVINFGTTYSNANVTAYLPTHTGNISGTITEAAQPYITSLGNLSDLMVQGTITALLVNAATDGIHYGDHEGQVGASVPNSGKFTTITVSGNANINTMTAVTIAADTIGNTGSLIYGAISTATQPSITSIGTLTALTVSGTANITNTRGNIGGPFNGTVGAITPNTGSFTTLTTSGDVTIGGNLTISGIQTVVNSTTISVNDLNLVLANNAASAAAADGAGISVNGANASIVYTHATTSWNFNKPIIGTNGIQNTPIGNATASTGAFTTLLVSDTANITGTINATTLQAATIGNAGATLIGTISGPLNGPLNGTVGATTANTGAFTSITAVSTTDSTSATTGAVVISGGLGIAKNMTIGGNIIPNANVQYNIGSTTANWNNIYAVNFTGTSTTAKYADLAENYIADLNYDPGTVLDFGGDEEVTLSNNDNSNRVAGVVSTNPAHLMNSTASGKFVIAVALIGRVPCKVKGPVSKGDTMISAGNGYARAAINPHANCIIGKAIENFVGDTGVIEVVVGRL